MKSIKADTIDQTISKLHSLVAIYAQLVILLRETGDERFVALADSAAKSIVQLNGMLANEGNSKTIRDMSIGLRQGLREVPKLLIAVAPECGAQLVLDIEDKLGCRFSDF